MAGVTQARCYLRPAFLTAFLTCFFAARLAEVLVVFAPDFFGLLFVTDFFTALFLG